MEVPLVPRDFHLRALQHPHCHISEHSRPSAAFRRHERVVSLDVSTLRWAQLRAGTFAGVNGRSTHRSVGPHEVHVHRVVARRGRGDTSAGDEVHIRCAGFVRGAGRRGGRPRRRRVPSRPVGDNALTGACPSNVEGRARRGERPRRSSGGPAAAVGVGAGRVLGGGCQNGRGAHLRPTCSSTPRRLEVAMEAGFQVGDYGNGKGRPGEGGG